MALHKFSKLLLPSANLAQRSFHVSAVNKLLNKPLPTTEIVANGYQRIEMEAAKVGEDPLDANRNERFNAKGSGTKADPFIIPSRNHKRLVFFDPKDDRGPLPYFWVTAEEGGRCSVTGRHYKLDVIEEDKWGIDELDLFLH